MCFFLTIGVPEQHADAMRPALKPFELSPTANASVRAALPPGYAARLLVSAGCSCDFYQSPRRVNRTERLRRKYGRRGWSDAKVARAVEQATRDQPPQWNGLRGDIARGLQALCETTGRVAVLIHWYHGDLESERFQPGTGPTRRCDAEATWAAELREDEVLTLVPPTEA